MTGPGSRAAVNAMAMMEELSARGPEADLPIREITVVPGFNPRRLLSGDAFTDEALQDLASSIRERGVLQPVIVRRQGDQIQLVAGERRLSAARLAGLKRVPVVFVEANDDQAYELAIIENAQRQNLDLVTETLVGFDFLSRRLGMPQEEVLAYLNAVRKKRREDTHNVEALLRSTYGTGIITWSLRRAPILNMRPEEHAAIRQGQVDVKVCAELVALPDPSPARAELLRRAVEEHLSARQVRELVQAELSRVSTTPPTVRQRVGALQKALPRLARLKGQQATQAEHLLTEMEAKLAELLGD